MDRRRNESSRNSSPRSRHRRRHPYVRRPPNKRSNRLSQRLPLSRPAEVAIVPRNAGGLDARDITILASTGFHRDADC